MSFEFLRPTSGGAPVPVKVRLVFTDIDGVWTDGGMYYDDSSDAPAEWKKFNTSDSAGVKFCRLARVPVVVITGERTEIVSRRCRKLAVERVHLGIADKLHVARQVCAEAGVDLAECAYVGDDVPDIPLLSQVGYAAVPASAPPYVARHAHVVLSRRGGEGVFREFVESMLTAERREGLLREWLETLARGRGADATAEPAG